MLMNRTDKRETLGMQCKGKLMGGMLGCIVMGILSVSNPVNAATITPLLKTETSWDGEKIVYPSGDAEVTSVRLQVNETDEAKFHCHPMPGLGHIVKGTIEVETIDGKKIQLHEGQSIVEVMNTVHKSRSIDGPAEAILFFAGAKGLPVTVLPENDPDKVYCK